MYITRHATARLRERLGIPKTAVERNAAKALTKGITVAETTGRLRQYLDYLYLCQHKANNVRIHTRYVYIFQDERLITVFPLPQVYRKAVDKIQRRNSHA